MSNRNNRHRISSSHFEYGKEKRNSTFSLRELMLIVTAAIGITIGLNAQNERNESAKEIRNARLLLEDVLSDPDGKRIMQKKLLALEQDILCLIHQKKGAEFLRDRLQYREELVQSMQKYGIDIPCDLSFPQSLLDTTYMHEFKFTSIKEDIVPSRIETIEGTKQIVILDAKGQWWVTCKVNPRIYATPIKCSIIDDTQSDSEPVRE